MAARGRRELLAAQWQADSGISEGQRDIVAVAGHDDALAYVAGVNRAIAHVASPVGDERVNQNHGDFAVRAHRRFEELFDGVALPSSSWPGSTVGLQPTD